MGCAVGRGEVLVAEGEIEQAAHASNIAAAAYLKSTR
jgi:hypothetical protein